MSGVPCPFHDAAHAWPGCAFCWGTGFVRSQADPEPDGIQATVAELTREAAFGLEEFRRCFGGVGQDDCGDRLR